MAKNAQRLDVSILPNKKNKRGEIIQNVFIGIDTGVHTGFAVWCSTTNKFIELVETKIHRAMFKVLRYATSDKYHILGVRIEDARKRSVNKSNPIYRQRLQSAGSVKRDAVVWEDFLNDYKKFFPYQMVAPQSNITKMSREDFMQRFGIDVPSDHIRDACMLVANFRNVPMLSDKEYNKKEFIKNQTNKYENGIEQ